MKIDPIRELLEEADLKALIDEFEAHPDLDHVTVVTLKAWRVRVRCAEPHDKCASVSH
jgi:hypothetical protein